MDYDVGKNFEKIEAILADDAKRIELLEKAVKYLMAKAGAVPIPKPVAAKKAEVVEAQETEEEPEEEETVVEEIVQQEHEEPTIKQKKKRWIKKRVETGTTEEPERIL